MTSTEIRFDWDRAARTGVPEAVLCSGKSIQQLDAIIQAATDRNANVLFTRLDAEQAAQLSFDLDYDPVSRTAVLGQFPEPSGIASVAIVTGGSSDIPVASEAARTLHFLGHGTMLFADVGVAGLWRLLDQIDTIRRHRVVIAVAGMEGALFSVLAGLVASPVIAVPASVGYGVGAGGQVALQSALATCAPGVVVVNIDNGYGAAIAAAKMMRSFLSDDRKYRA